jgi:hypothetical protein
VSAFWCSRPVSAKPGSKRFRTRLDEFFPAFQFHEVHGISIAAPPERVYAATAPTDPDVYNRGLGSWGTYSSGGHVLRGFAAYWRVIQPGSGLIRQS